VALPLTDRTIPVIADTAVDPAFGTGAVKVTPSHDFNDEAMARRQNPPLPFIAVIDEAGKMMEASGPAYAGLDRYACRKKVLADLAQAGLIEKEEKHRHGVGHCYRCRTVIEPLATAQWYVDVKPLAAVAIDAVRSGKIRIIPRGWENTYFSWMENIKDWCISRQIWWGHQIPAWTCEACGELIVSESDPDHCPQCKSKQLLQETDVLDTWFSSALWPFSTLGWPDDTAELKFFYPTSVLITSFDILFFWVSRMMMMGIHFMGKVPFKDVYLHALVRDAQGQKMSKSKGNVMDPLLIMDKYGTDALRFTMTAFAAQGRDIRLSEERIEGYRYFINKIWNASRFALMHISDCDPSVTRGITPDGLGLAHRWILSRFNRTVAEVHRSLHDYRFNDAASAMYQFVWHEFCDWYLELIKPELFSDANEKKQQARAVLFTVLEAVIKLLHPVIPFVTEEIWHVLPGARQSVMTEAYPRENPVWDDAEAEATAQLVMGLIGGIRNIRSEMQIHPSAQVEAIVICHNQAKKNTIEQHCDQIKGMTRTATLTLRSEGHGPKGAAAYIFEDIEIAVPLAGLIDVQKELDKLTKEQAKIDKQLSQSQGKLSNKKFLENAPEDVVAKEKEKVEALSATLEKIEQSRKRLREIGG
jgi:valyl-tRNA synthetase